MLTTLKRVAQALALVLPASIVNAQTLSEPEFISPGTQLVCETKDDVLHVASAAVNDGVDGIVPAMQEAGCVFFSVPGPVPVSSAEYITDVTMGDARWELWLVELEAGDKSLWFLYRMYLGPKGVDA